MGNLVLIEQNAECQELEGQQIGPSWSSCLLSRLGRETNRAEEAPPPFPAAASYQRNMEALLTAITYTAKSKSGILDNYP